MTPDRKLRINILLFHPSVGGGDRVVSIYAKYLQEQGHEVNLIARPAMQRSWRERIRTFIKTGRLSGPKINLRLYDGANLDVKIIRGNGPIQTNDLPDADILLATYWTTAEWALCIAPKKGAKVYFIQGNEALFPGTPVDRAIATYRAPLKQIVISAWLDQVMRNEHHATPVACIPNSVDTNQFYAPERTKGKKPSVGFLHSNSGIKGVTAATNAIKILQQTFPDLKIVAFGTNDPDELLPLPTNATMTVLPAQSDIRNIYAQCDVWICPSRLEGFGFPMLEAMACRCPVVTTDVGAARDLIENGRQGYIVPIDDHEAIAEKTLSILNASDDEWRKMSDTAYKTATRYSWNDAGALFENALYEIADDAQPHKAGDH